VNIIQRVQEVAVQLGYGRVKLKCDGARCTGGEVSESRRAVIKGAGSDV